MKHGNSLIDFLLNLQVHTEILGISRLCAKYASTPIKEAVNQFRHSFDWARNRIKGGEVKEEGKKRGSGDEKIPIELISGVSQTIKIVVDFVVVGVKISTRGLFEPQISRSHLQVIRISSVKLALQ